MGEAWTHESKHAALELHRLLEDLDPSRWREDLVDAVRARAAALRQRFSELWTRGEDPVATRAADIAALLERLPASERADDWTGFRKKLGAAYEHLSLSLQARAIELPSLRPTNYTRSAFHAGIAIAVLLLIEHVLSPSLLWLPPLVVALTFWSLEVARAYSKRAQAFLLWLFRSIAHPRERHRINSSTWFASALTLLAIAFEPMICAVAVMVLGLADPAAALVGRRWGRTKLIHKRSLEGTLTFAVVGFVAAFGVLAIWHGAVATSAKLAIAAGASLCGATAELFSRRIDDNFSIPMAAALGGMVGLLLVG